MDSFHDELVGPGATDLPERFFDRFVFNLHRTDATTPSIIFGLGIQPARDLVARIKLDTPADIVDLGCGPGNSTRVLADRWPHAHLVGIDNSSNMIEAARQSRVAADQPG